MNKRVNVLRDIPDFSPKGQEVYEALAAVQADDKRIERFARRAARAITAYDAGNIGKSGPLERFLLCGTSFSSIPFLVQVLADTWLGKPWDGSSPFIYVDCSAYHAVYPGMLAPLVGPLPPDALGFQAAPLLAQIEVPHLKARRGEDLRKLQEWSEAFQRKWSDEIERLGMQVSQFWREFRLLTSEAWQEIYREEQEKRGPFGSVIFFDGVDRASQPLHELILQILHNGSLTLATGGRVDFSHSIVIASIYQDELLRGKGDMGFAQQKGGSSDGEDSLAKHYYDVRKFLLGDNGSAAFVQSVAENLIIVNERTRESQAKRVEAEFEKIKRQFKNHSIELSFTENFTEGFIEDTRESVREGSSRAEVYTEERIVSGIKRHVLDPLHRLIFFGKLRVGSSLRFDRGEGPKFSAEVLMEQDGEGETLTPETVRSRRETGAAGDASSQQKPEWLTKLDLKARKLLRP